MKPEDVNNMWYIIAAVVVVASIISIYAQKAAYRNGVCDGYGYKCEPWNPGYRRAGYYLREHMVHRWPELAQVLEDQIDRRVPEQPDSTADLVSDFFDARPVDPQVNLPLGQPDRRQR